VIILENLDKRTYRLLRKPFIEDICIAANSFVKSIDKFSETYLNILSEEEKKSHSLIIDSVEKYTNYLKDAYKL
jgi:hypothetical protein